MMPPIFRGPVFICLACGKGVVFWGAKDGFGRIKAAMAIPASSKRIAGMISFIGLVFSRDFGVGGTDGLGSGAGA